MGLESRPPTAVLDGPRTASVGPAAPAADVAKPGSVLAGKYVVEKILGQGGMGVVVAAQHLHLGERVAIKLLATEGPEAAARFLREARAAARIKSDRVVRVMDMGTLETGQPYLVMEHLAGEDLAAIVKARGPLPIAEAADCVLQACAAMADAHRLGIVHRDLKPSNLFVTEDATGKRVVKVLDFGIAKAAIDERSDGNAGLTGIKTFLGSLPYASPEQLSSARDVDARADVWSLGVILVELLTNRRPFAGSSPSAVLAAIAETPEPPIVALRRDIPARLEALALACLERDVDRRIPNVAALAIGLAPFAPSSSRGLVERAAELLGVALPRELRSRSPKGTSVAASGSAAMSEEEHEIVAGRFRLVRELRRGGMGSVWLGHNVALDVPCAVKFIDGAGADDPSLRARFEREAKAAAQLRSPNVVQILDHGLWRGRPYIAMELLEGEDLQDRLTRGRLPFEETAIIVNQVARALGKAHAMGIVHRDLKPDNVFLARDEDREIVKVLDFGIAKAVRVDDGFSKTATGALLGTPNYMSPEQADGTLRVDFRSDLWSLGVIVFQCLTGRLPFESEALGDLLNRIMNKPIPVPSVFAPWAELPAAFDGWFARACCRVVEERFSSAKEMADALQKALGVAGAADVLRTAVDGGRDFPTPQREVLGSDRHPSPLAETHPVEGIASANSNAPAPTFDGQARPEPPPAGGARRSRLGGRVLAGASILGVAALAALLIVATRGGEVRGTSPEVSRSSPASSTAPSASDSASGAATASATAEPEVSPAASAVDAPVANASAAPPRPSAAPSAQRLQTQPHVGRARPAASASAKKSAGPAPDDPGY